MPFPISRRPRPRQARRCGTPCGPAATRVTLLDGVTGSGKTEVYFEAVAEAISRGRQSLILMPEIALTAQTLDRFARRFGVRPAEWHSELSPRMRARTWQAVAAGEVSVVAGARSALFLPYADLGLVIVDEEHDAVYKQEDGVHYHARDMAVVRGHIARFPVVLASATPSIETEVNARRGRYRRLALPERFGGQHMPGVEAIDLTREGPPRGRYIAPRLAEAVKIALQRGQQALLFLNRRGYAPLTLCRACGFRFACPNCDAWLVDHRFKRQLACHHCGFFTPRPATCPKCLASDSFVACGPGVERLEEEAAALFPQARIMVLSSDLIATAERMREEFKADRGRPCGHRHRHPAGGEGTSFPEAQSGGDHRCRSRPEQWRSARLRAHLPAAAPGRRPRRPQIRPRLRLPADPSAGPSGDAGADRLRPRGLLRERDRRRASAPGYPPFGRLASIVVSGPDRPSTEGFARRLCMAAPQDEAVRVLGPAEAPIAVVRGRHRFRVLIKAPRAYDLSAYLRDWLGQAPKPATGIKLEVDIDPMSFL